MKKEQKNRLQLALLICAVAFIAISIGMAATTGSKVTALQREAAETARPAELEMITLLSGCDECDAQLSSLTNKIKSSTKITQEQTLSPEDGAAYVQQYDITKLPALILTGEVKKAKIAGMELRDDALLFEANTPPYATATGETVGLISATLLTDDSCDGCAEPSTLVAALQQAGIVFGAVEEIDAASAEGKALISQYSLEQVPVIILEGGIDAYPEIAAALPQLGSVQGETYIIDQGLVPYKEISSGQLRGIVDVTYLVDTSCEECYDVQLHKQILGRLNLKIGEERTIDVSDAAGKALLEQYAITKVPTIILSAEAGRYPVLVGAWKPVGTEEEDGTFVFRKVDAMGTYKDLESGEVVTQ